MKDLNYVFYDLDGVMVDWFGGVCDLLSRNREHELTKWPAGANTETALGVERDHMWSVINRLGLDWWKHLEPLHKPGDLFSLFSDSTAELGILTNPENSDYAASGKKLWISEHLGSWSLSVHMTKKKYLMAKPGRLLIDDDDKNCREFIEAGGYAILFPQPWNAARNHRHNPIEYLKANLEEAGFIS